MAIDQPVTFNAYLSPVKGPMVHHVIQVPEEAVVYFRQSKGPVRILCSISGYTEFPCALNPRGNNYIIIASKALIKSHKLKLDIPFTVCIRKDVDNGLLLPEELEEVLDQDEWGKSLFEGLLLGHKRGLIYYIRSAKSVDIRIKRALDIIDKIKTGRLHVQKKSI